VSEKTAVAIVISIRPVLTDDPQRMARPLFHHTFIT